MVRNYKRKTNRASWSEEAMKNAIIAVKEENMSYGKAAEAFHIPKTVLYRHCCGMLKMSAGDNNLHKKVLGSKRPVLTMEQEKLLVEYLKKMDDVFYGLTIMDLQKLVFQYAEKNKIPHVFNKERGLAGRDFIESFLKRNPSLSLRKPQGVALNRVFGLNKEAVALFFDNLETLLNKHNFQPHQVFNCDESGITTVHRPMKVISSKGKHCVSSATSGEKGVTTTVICAFSCTGQYVPPMMIFKRKKKKPELIDHAPPGTIDGVSDNGWVTTELFEEYIHHFVKHTNCSPSNKVLLILDGHKTHTKNLKLIDYCREHGLVLLSLPPHTSHKLQPLDRSFFKPLKTGFNVACQSWMRTHPGRRITVDQLGELFNIAYSKAASVEIAVSGFRTSGIHPFNRDIIPESSYAVDVREDANKNADEENEENVQEAEVGVQALDEVTVVEKTVDTSFEDIASVPVVKNIRSRKGEQSAIITESPHRSSLLDKPTNKPSCSSTVTTSTKRNLANDLPIGKQKAKGKKKVRKEQDWECYVCGGLWLNAKVGENWVLCSVCGTWVHEECCTFPKGKTVCDLC